MQKVAFVVFAALAGTSLPALAQSEPADAGAALLAPGSLTTELPNGFQQNSNSKLQALIPGDLSRFVDRKPEQTAVEAFYQGRNHLPIWTGSPEALTRAEGAIAFLRNVKSEGLEPRDYPTPDLSGNLSDEQTAKAELQLTGSILRYARHASSGRVSYTRVSASILYPDHAADPADVLDKVASAQDMNAVLQSFEPQQPGFLALKAALAKELAKPEQDPPLQDRDVSKKHRGKDADDRSRKNAVGTIIANMERWRWLPRDLGEAHVVVNVPDFTLGVYKDGATVWRTKIVVGKPGNLATPLLSETMKFLTVNPTWNVPPSIIRNEYLPALERDPGALERIGLRVSNNRTARCGSISRPASAMRLDGSGSTSRTSSSSISTIRRTRNCSRAMPAHSVTAACACRIRKNMPRCCCRCRSRRKISPSPASGAFTAARSAPST